MYRQNIAVGLQAPDISTIITDLFYVCVAINFPGLKWRLMLMLTQNGEVNYYPVYGKEPSMNNFEKWGHFSQVVWKGTKSVGCATVDCRKQGLKNWPYPNAYFTVCNYELVSFSPPSKTGTRTVLTSSSQATISANSGSRSVLL